MHFKWISLIWEAKITGWFIHLSSPGEGRNTANTCVGGGQVHVSEEQKSNTGISELKKAVKLYCFKLGWGWYQEWMNEEYPVYSAPCKAVSVPFKTVCRKIGPALWKIDSTDFVKMNEKTYFPNNVANFQPWLLIKRELCLYTFCGKCWQYLNNIMLAVLLD